MAARLKRSLDVVASALVLALLSPLLCALALAVRLSSPGPLLYRQKRLGLDGVPFVILKFRTMFLNCEDIRNKDGSTYNGEDDPRVTKIGRWLRKTSLDELPQFWNVIRGEMSVVGPRPDQVDQLRYYTAPEDQLKLRMRPGITGLAQISGRNRLSWERRRQMDREYVRCWSLSLDIRILWKTIPYVLLRKDIHIEQQEHSSEWA